MRKFFAAVLAVAIVMIATQAKAWSTYTYTCTDTQGELQSRLDGVNFWTSSTGANPAAPVSGDVIELTNSNTPCLGDIYVATSGLIFRNVNNTQSAGAKINGMFEVVGARVTIYGLQLECTICNATQTSTTLLSPQVEAANLVARDGASVTLQYSLIGGSGGVGGTNAGIWALRSSSVALTDNTQVMGTGANDTGGLFSDAIYAAENSTVELGGPDAGDSVDIEDNGTRPSLGKSCAGYGIHLTQNSTLHSYNFSTVGATTPNGCAELYVTAGSSVWLSSAEIGSQSSLSTLPVVQVLDGSSLWAELDSQGYGSDIDAPATALLVADGSHAVFNWTGMVNGSGSSAPLIEASTNSSIVLAGGNQFDSPGTVIEIDHSSSLLQQAPAKFGYSPAADTIYGNGSVLMQSSMELGQGSVSSAFSLVWNGAIVVGQNSAIRMQGGAHITGSVQVSAASNAYFNCNNAGGVANAGCTAGGSTGAANEVDGQVQCLELVSSPDNPSVHVSNPQAVVRDTSNDPGVAVANLTGPSSFVTPPGGGIAANTCLNF